jgi:hypothetical protein
VECSARADGNRHRGGEDELRVNANCAQISASNGGNRRRGMRESVIDRITGVVAYD